MDEEKIRELLDRYRLVGPPADLRARALAPVTRALRVWPWAAAAAALLAATVGLHVASNRESHRGGKPVARAERSRACA